MSHHDKLPAPKRDDFASRSSRHVPWAVPAIVIAMLAIAGVASNGGANATQQQKPTATGDVMRR